VIVVPFFISDGLHSYEDIPILLGISPDASGSALVRQNPHHLHGRDLYYANAIGTAPQFADIILAQVSAFDAVELDLGAIA
jgi:sirohydrochlorin cobaltochelatase